MRERENKSEDIIFNDDDDDDDICRLTFYMTSTYPEDEIVQNPILYL